MQTPPSLLIFLIGCVGGPFLMAHPSLLPAPGSVYRETTLVMSGNDWRVTDPDVEFERGLEFLPNPELILEGIELEGAIRAELLIDYWAGHPGTTHPRFRFNRHKWIPLQVELAGTDRPVLDYTAQLNLLVDVPLDDLKEGVNILQGSCDTNEWGWGQWGWSSARLRVFYDSSVVVGPEGRLTVQPGTILGGNPELSVTVGSGPEVAEVLFFARYEGVDENGDGVYQDFHGMMHAGEWTGHLGTAAESPWSIIWDTDWVPDQVPGSIEITALICSTEGVWSACEVVGDLSLQRPGRSVRLYPAEGVNPGFWVRNGELKSCLVRIPDADDLDNAVDARQFLRTWNPENNEEGFTPFRLNTGSWVETVTGPGHQFHLEAYPLDPRELQNGHNLLSYRSSTKHHGCELLWPGPSVLVRYEVAPAGTQ